ncbi:MAG: hypothetical protein KatS3mg008_0133 [Acidimicrobiales bacterium]|nr:MAG: hypothetical protein KatS3mg008_0133 [Acidimicrobiales bacterium]
MSAGRDRRIAAVHRSQIRRRLASLSEELRNTRAELEQVEHELAIVAWEEEQAAVRAITADDPYSKYQHKEALKHREALERHRQVLSQDLRRLEAEIDSLLDRISHA